MSPDPAPSNYQAALAAAEKLNMKSQNALFQELGLRIQDMPNKNGYQRSMKYEGQFTENALTMLSTADLQKYGELWFQNFKADLMSLACDKNNPEIKSILSGKGIPEMAAGLAVQAVVAAFGPPAWVIVGTTIFATILVGTTLETLCKEFKGSTVGH